MIKDISTRITTSKDDFLKILEEKEINTTRYVVDSKNVLFRELAFSDTKKLNNEAIEDTLENTELVVQFKDNDGNIIEKCLGSSAWISIKGRIKIYGGGFDDLPNELKIKILNNRFHAINDKITVVICYEKVRAIMSKQYMVVPAKNVFKEAFEHSETRFGNFEFENGSVCHNFFNAAISFPEKSKDLLDVYNIPDEFVPGLLVETSDTGYSASRVIPRWVFKKGKQNYSMQLLAESIEMRHMGEENDIASLKETLPILFSKYNNTVEKLISLMNISIAHPIETTEYVCKTIKMPGKYARMAIESMDLNLPWTAYDIVINLMGICALGENPSDLEVKVGKALFLNYKQIDENI